MVCKMMPRRAYRPHPVQSLDPVEGAFYRPPHLPQPASMGVSHAAFVLLNVEVQKTIAAYVNP